MLCAPKRDQRKLVCLFLPLCNLCLNDFGDGPHLRLSTACLFGDGHHCQWPGEDGRTGEAPTLATERGSCGEDPHTEDRPSLRPPTNRRKEDILT